MKKCHKCGWFTTCEELPCAFCTGKAKVIETGSTSKGGPYKVGKLK